MMPQLLKQNTELLEAALIGYQLKRAELEAKIAELRGHTGAKPAPGLASGVTKRTMSEAARRRIALAQKKRWAAYKAAHGKPARKAQQRVLSAEGRARIVAATKKRWAAYRKANAS